jgi:uncharacterized ion transporter superfamily protein YfcC
MSSKFPHTLLIILGFILLAGVATYLLPTGEYERKVDAQSGKEVVVPGSYHHVEAKPISPFAVFVGIPRGIAAGVEVIITIFICGACFYVVEKTGALRQGILQITQKLKGREEVTLVLTGLFFLVGATLEGMEEELIPLTPVLLMLTRRLGYNAFVAVATSYGSAVIGASLSPFNPFGAVLAQRIAEVPLLSGAMFRMAILLLAFVLWMVVIIRYANKNRLPRDADEGLTEPGISSRHGAILGIVVLAFALLIVGMMNWDWGFNEMSAEFFLVGMAAGLIGRLGLNGTSVAFVEGLREMTFAALIVGFAHAIPLVLADGKVLDTIIYGLLVPLDGLPPAMSAVGMMLSQSALHIVVPSYTGLAALTLPILGPLSDLIGLSRQVCVLAFQYGAILMNAVSPTNGALMAILALSGIRYDHWLAFAVRRLGLVYLLCMVAVIAATFLIS